MNHDSLLLFSKILHSPKPPKGVVVVLSAFDEGPMEQTIRTAHAETLGQDVTHALAMNTYLEARSVRGLSDAMTDLIIVTSAYHQLRAFLTFVRVFEDTSVRLWNSPAPSSWEKLEGELLKITGYQLKGHCASYADGLEHLAWRDSYHCAGAA